MVPGRRTVISIEAFLFHQQREDGIVRRRIVEIPPFASFGGGLGVTTDESVGALGGEVAGQNTCFPGGVSSRGVGLVLTMLCLSKCHAMALTPQRPGSDTQAIDDKWTLRMMKDPRRDVMHA